MFMRRLWRQFCSSHAAAASAILYAGEENTMTATLTAIEFTSVDGVMQGLGSPDEDRDGGFTHGGWGADYAPGIAEVGVRGAIETQAYLFGRRTFEKMAAFWPTQSDNNPIAASLNSRPKYVVSSTLRDPDWAYTTVLDGNPSTTVAELKEQVEGTIAILGSGVLLNELMRADLLDELYLFVHPLLLGTGKQLFRGLPHPTTLRLVDVNSTSLGSLALRYTLNRQ
jgi:dihydrofolate reductase